VDAARHQELTETTIALLRELNIHSDQFVAKLGAAHGLHRTDLNAIGHLAGADAMGVALGPSQLAERLHLGAPATTSLLDRLERSGHIERSPHPSDRRRHLIHIRPEVAAEFQQFFAPLAERWRAAAAQFTTEELQTVARFLEVMDAELQAVDDV